MLRITALISCVLGSLVTTSSRAQEASPDWIAQQQLPRWVQPLLADSTFRARYSIDLGMNPFVVQGDFDRDQRRDVAIWVRERTSGKAGIAVIRQARRTPEVIGAGVDPLGIGADDFSRMDIWRVEPAGKQSSAGDVLYVEKSESGSGVIRWDGRQYRWTQLGD